MLIVLIVIWSAAIIVCGLGLYQSIQRFRRNKAVGRFRLTLHCMSFGYNMRHLEEAISGERDDAFEWFSEKYTYDQMLNSKKNLDLESWYTPEEIHKIKN